MTSHRPEAAALLSLPRAARNRIYDTEHCHVELPSAFFLSVFLCTLAVVAGCGPGSGETSSSVPPSAPPPTMVILELSGTANDQLALFGIQIANIDLVNQSGTSVNLYQYPVNPVTRAPEFMHLNGGVAPVAEGSVPQDVYVGANVTLGASAITCITVSSGGIVYSTFGYGITSFSNVKLASPVRVEGDAMILSMDLQVSQSASLPTCDSSSSYSITSTFLLTPVVIASRPTNTLNGKLPELKGSVSSVDSAANSVTLTFVDSLPGAGTTTVAVDENTTYSGITGLSALAEGMLVDLDAAVQPDGSFLATRVAIEDQTATNAQAGLLLFTSAAEPAFVIANRQFQGSSIPSTTFAYSFGGSTVFQVSSEFSNLASLPFSPNFSSSTMVGGQNIYVGSLNFSNEGSFPYTPATSVTLLPQTINGTISGISTTGGFQVYTVTLAAYDLFPTLPAQTGLGYALSNPNVVTVYVDGNAQLLNTSPIEVGSVARFHGLIFNDNGNLRMDCNQVNDGVAE